MTLSHTPVPARSDIRADQGMVASTTSRPFLVHGRVISAGAALWAAATLVAGNNPHTSLGLALFGIGSGAFQIGLYFLLRVLWRTQALGEGRLARFFLRVEAVFVTLAIGSTLVDAVGISDLSQPGWVLLDAFWPFSMLGMFFIGIRIAIAGRWKGLSRFWPMVAESWAVVVIPTINIFGADAAKYVSAAHLLIGYTLLGVLVSRKDS